MVRVSFFLGLFFILCSCNKPESSDAGHDELNEIDTANSVNGGGIQCCTDSLINLLPDRIKFEVKAFETNAGSNLVDDVERKKVFSDSRSRAWIESSEEIKVYSLENSGQLIFLFSGHQKQATGLMVNFTKWLIIDGISGNSLQTISLSNSPELFFFNKETSSLNCVLLDFDESFIFNRDFEHVKYKISTYIIKLNDAGLELKNQTQSFCTCK